MRQIAGNEGWLTCNSLDVIIGLGDATNIDLLRLEWPSGIVQQFANVPVKQQLTITEPTQLAMAQPRQLEIKGWGGMSWMVEGSSDLQSWKTLQTVTNTGASAIIRWTDPLTNSPSFFYRAVGR